MRTGCQFHAATITVVFELFHDATGRRADEPVRFGTTASVMLLDSRRNIRFPKRAFRMQRGGRLDELFDVIDVDERPVLPFELLE